MNDAPIKHAVLTLPKRLDYASSLRMLSDLRNMLSAPVEVDASQVTHLGAHSAQILLSAQKQWDIDKAAFLIKASPAFQKCWETLGFPQASIEVTTPS